MIKKMNETEIKELLQTTQKEVETIVNKEIELRTVFFQKLEKEIAEIKEKSGYNYILSEISTYNLYSNKYANDRRNSLMIQKLQKYFYRYIDEYKIINFQCCYLYQFENIEIKNNKIKFNVCILDNLNNSTAYDIYLFLQFFNTVSNIDIPEWNYDFYKQFNDSNKKYSLNDKIDFKIYKNGKIELYIK